MATGPIFAGAGGDSRGKERWAETNNSSKKLNGGKPQNKSQNPKHIPRQKDDRHNSSRPRPQKLDTVASGDSSSHNHPQLDSHIAGFGNSLRGYVKFDNKVRISLNDSSKSVIRELKRKLVGELDQVRSLKRKLEAAKEIHYNGGIENEMIFGGDGRGAVHSNRVGSLVRVNSEVSYVGPTNPRSLPVDDVKEKVDKEKKAPKVKQNQKNPVSGVEKEKTLNSGSKKLKKGGGGKVMELGSGMDRYNKEIFNKCGDLLGKLMKHQYGWVFNKPVDVKKLMLHDYYKIIKHPMDLGTVKSRLQKNWYKSPDEFAEDVRLTFNNAMTYNEKGQDAHIMAAMLLKLFEEKWSFLKGKHFDERFSMENDASLPASTSKRAPVPPAPAPAPAPVAGPPPRMPLETRTLDRAESMTKPIDSNLKGTDIDRHEGETTMAKKIKSKDPQKREMTLEEKQRLSTDLLNLPSEKLDSVVQIIKKRNPGLCQQEDEIEVDIDSFDNETLWELDRLVTNYKMSLSQNKRTFEPAHQAIEETGHNYQASNQVSTAAEMPEETGAIKNIATTSPDQGEKQGDNVSGSSSSRSSSSDSGSSSSDSDSDSASRYGSDAGQ